MIPIYASRHYAQKTYEQADWIGSYDSSNEMNSRVIQLDLPILQKWKLRPTECKQMDN